MISTKLRKKPTKEDRLREMLRKPANAQEEAWVREWIEHCCARFQRSWTPSEERKRRVQVVEPVLQIVSMQEIPDPDE